MPNRANRGLSHVIEDVHFNKGATGVKEGLTVGAISAVSIGAGASVGRFGPAVHLGAAAASGLGAVLELDDQERLTLSCAGMAAAISASFLSPLAAVIFVQEVVLRQWRLYQFIPIAAAAVAASAPAPRVEHVAHVEALEPAREARAALIFESLADLFGRLLGVVHVFLPRRFACFLCRVRAPVCCGAAAAGQGCRS